MSKDMISIEKLNFIYSANEESSEKYAVEDIDLNIKEGEFIAILGHNGSGKSTIAKHINALLLPSRGKVVVDGLDTLNSDYLWDIRSNVGMVFQNPDNQFVATIVEEEVAFGPENLGVLPSEIRKRVDESLEKVGMSEYTKKSTHMLSGGQKQRIAIAGVLAMHPKCIVFDEPTAMLDPLGRKEVMKNIKELNSKNGMTIVLITHYMDEAAEADRVIVVDDGHIVLQGKPKNVFSEVETIKKLGLDVPQVTELAYELRKRGIDISTEILNVDEMVNALCQLK